jgi:hypothetical protein
MEVTTRVAISHVSCIPFLLMQVCIPLSCFRWLVTQTQPDPKRDVYHSGYRFLTLCTRTCCAVHHYHAAHRLSCPFSAHIQIPTVANLSYIHLFVFQAGFCRSHERLSGLFIKRWHGSFGLLWNVGPRYIITEGHDRRDYHCVVSGFASI